MSEVYAARRARLRERCAAGGSEAALVSGGANVRYLTGGAPPGAALLIGPDQDVLVCASDPFADSTGTSRPADDLRVMLLPSPEGDPAVAGAERAAGRGRARWPWRSTT